MEREVGAGGNQIYRLGYQYQAYLLAHIVRGQQEELRAGTPFLGLSAKWDFLWDVLSLSDMQGPLPLLPALCPGVLILYLVVMK